MNIKKEFFYKLQINLILTFIIIYTSKNIISKTNLLIITMFFLYVSVDFFILNSKIEKIKKGWVLLEIIAPKKVEHILLSIQKQAQNEHQK